MNIIFQMSEKQLLKETVLEAVDDVAKEVVESEISQLQETPQDPVDRSALTWYFTSFIVEEHFHVILSAEKTRKKRKFTVTPLAPAY